MRFFSLLFDILFFLFVLICFIYLLPPSPPFPDSLPDAVQSLDLADTETPFRRAYYTNFSRKEILFHYQTVFGNISIMGLSIPSLSLNYPPEEAFAIIRDQTKSNALEEVVYPFRESVFINGFEPKEDNDAIWYKGVHYARKITVKYNPSNIYLRMILGGVSLGIFYFVLKLTLVQVGPIVKSLKTLVLVK